MHMQHRSGMESRLVKGLVMDHGGRHPGTSPTPLCISLYLPTHPYTSPHLPTPPYTSLHPPYTPHTPPYTSLHLPTPPYTSLHLPISPCISLHLPAGMPKKLSKCRILCMNVDLEYQKSEVEIS